ncbi:FAD-dependent oxidoreductase [Streptomyces purpurogeneiscleroticus]|uniref:FAD-dependent oxidoreductase n=1 Tax=Streptomyces purpurogeneiscleroticus TaxID=68259 RepID=UPI001CBFAC32|nr:FAD-dependent oxidoreductase [Streptomyces purpurogeneiscleroticus]MBZ4019432.1 3-hydroxybenzoate 6-hydroxylase [Streptomyces purpurogeneiscleroticus]
MSSTDKIVVIGGGIGGMATALAARLSGREVTLLEQASVFTEVGAGLQMAPNATRVLRGLGVLDEVVEAGVRPDHLVFHNAVDGRELTRVRLDAAYEEHFGGPYVVAHRSDLLDILVRAAAAAGVDLRTGCRVEDIVQHPGSVTVRTADGTEFTGGAAVAADGLHSRTRAQFSDDRPIQSGYVAYRGTVPIEEVRGGGNLRDVLVWMGPKLHLVQYPLRSGALYNQVAVFRSPGFDRGAENWGGPQELEQVFAAACEPVRRALPGLGRERWWPMADREPLGCWTKDRLALLGDAAHPMLQYLAQGACQALEDAAALAGALDRHPVGSWPTALEEYAAVRAPLTARVQSTARVWGEMWHVEGVAALLRDEVFRSRATDDLGPAEWLWGRQAA